MEPPSLTREARCPFCVMVGILPHSAPEGDGRADYESHPRDETDRGLFRWPSPCVPEIVGLRRLPANSGSAHRRLRLADLTQEGGICGGLGGSGC
jgi:hypothetical protein